MDGWHNGKVFYNTHTIIWLLKINMKSKLEVYPNIFNILLVWYSEEKNTKINSCYELFTLRTMSLYYYFVVHSILMIDFCLTISNKQIIKQVFVKKVSNVLKTVYDRSSQTILHQQ